MTIRTTICGLTAAAAAALTTGMPTGAHAATLVNVTGSFYDADADFSDVNAAVAFADANEADATFGVTAIDYPRGDLGSLTSAPTTLAEFLGDDAASLMGDGTVTLEQSVFVFTGQIRLDGTEDTFTVGSDDGFRLSIGGQLISENVDPRGFEFTDATPGLSAGLYAFTLVYFENQVFTGVEFRVDGELVLAEAAIPLPAGAVLLLTGLGGLAAARRRG